MDECKIVKAQDPNKGWYILTFTSEKNGVAVFLQKDLTLRTTTGWSESNKEYGEAPGYYHSEAEAKQHLDAYLYIENLKNDVVIKNNNWPGCGWWICINNEYLWKNLTLNGSTGCSQKKGYYNSEREAQRFFALYVKSEKEKQLNKIRGTKMSSLEGKTVRLRDNSYCFGIANGKYSNHAGGGYDSKKEFVVVRTELNVIGDADGDRSGRFSEVCDILITDNVGGFWFTKSEFINVLSPEIEVKYFSNGKDITNKVSRETKRNLAEL